MIARARLAGSDGFTLLEVLIAFAILSIAIVSLIQLTSQGLRLVKVSGSHQQAVELADRITMGTEVNPDDVKADTPAVETGEEGGFAWERRIALLPLPDEIAARATIPGQEVPGLYSVTVAVRWGQHQMVEVATLRSPSQSTTTSTTSTPASTGPGTPGQPGTQAPTNPGATPPGATGTAGTTPATR